MPICMYTHVCMYTYLHLSLSLSLFMDLIAVDIWCLLGRGEGGRIESKTSLYYYYYYYFWLFLPHGMPGRVYTSAEVAKHAVKKDGWLIINNDVYNVSKFYDDHPGGRDVLLNLIGADATDAFEAVQHSDAAKRLLAGLKIGTLAQADAKKYMRLNDVKERQRKATEKTACWLVIANKVYDLTSFTELHPGGREVLLCEAGTDATLAHEKIGHSEQAKEMMKSYVVAELHPDDRRSTTSTAKESLEKNSNSLYTRAKDTSVRDFVLAQIQLMVFLSLGIVAVGFALIYV
ncbi:cytochrome b-domain protein, putative [Trypanosoma cruzi]|nr:cytochrome b-domain protein, putative [Trypanosoma cruzi]